MDIKGHVVQRRVGRARVRHRRGVLRVVHARPRREEAPRHAVARRAASTSSRSPTRTPTRSRASTSIRSTGSSEAQCRAWVEAAKLNPQATDGAVDILHEALHRVRRRRLRPRRDQPADPHARGQGARARRQGRARRQRASSATPSGTELTGLEKLDAREREAAEKGLQYVGLDGDVGVIANGAGLAMATCDIVHEVGGKPANFLDIGGGASADVMANALEVINNDPSVKSIFINIFGGITKGEEVANGIVQALGRVDIASPIVIRLDGTNAEQGREILKAHESDRLISQPTMVDAARKAVALRRRSRVSEHSRRRRHEGHRPGPHREPGPLLRAAQPRRTAPRSSAASTPRKAGTDVDGIPVFASVADAVDGDRRDRDDGDRPRARRGRRRDRSGRGRPRAHRRRHRGHPDARRGVLLQHGRRATSRRRASSARTARASSRVGRVQHRLHPRRGRASRAVRSAS